MSNLFVSLWLSAHRESIDKHVAICAILKKTE